MSLTIYGESGIAVSTISGVTYGMNYVARTPQSLGIKNYSLRFQNMGDDVFTYTVPLQNAKGLGTIVPRDGQEIHVFEGGVRIFKGHVVKPRFGIKTLTVTALGPWWWMGKIALSGEATDSTGGKADRASYVFNQGPLGGMLRTLVNRAEYMGVPMSRITEAEQTDRLGSFFSVLKTTLSNMSFAAAFSELMAYCPDAVMWFDYSTTLPSLMVRRRGSLGSQSWAVGTTGAVRVESDETFPRTDQEVKRVEVKYMTRNATTGLPKWAAQNHGSASAAADKRKIQIITVTGPEALAVVPKNEFESVDIQTAENHLPTSEFVRKAAGAIAANTKQFGKAGGIGTGYSGYAGWSWQYSKLTSYPFPPVQIRKRNGDTAATGGRYFLVLGELPDWAKKQLGAVEVKVTGSWASMWTETDFVKSPSAAWKKWEENAPIRSPAGLWANPYNKAPSAKAYKRRFWAYPFEITGFLINQKFSNAKAVFKEWDYDFIDPPDTFAESLFNAQDFLPWEGPVSIVGADMDGYNHIRSKHNITGAHPDKAAMAALCKSVTYDFQRQRLQLELGPPPRADLGGLVNKMRRQPQDAIYLRNPQKNLQ